MPRKLPNSVIKDPQACVARVIQLLQDGTVTTYSGNPLPMRAASILLHSDTHGAVRRTAAPWLGVLWLGLLPYRFI